MTKAERDAITVRKNAGRRSMAVGATKTKPEKQEPEKQEPEKRDLKKLKAHKDNETLFKPLPEDEYKRLKEDIQKNGIHDPLQITPDGVILAGHNRYKIALELNMKKVPVVIQAGLTPEKQREFLIRDNLLRRQIDAAQKAALLAELFPDYFKSDGTPGPKTPGDNSGNGCPNSEPETAAGIAKMLGVSEKTIKNTKALHKAATDLAAAHGRPAPTPDDYKAVAADIATKRRNKSTRKKSQKKTAGNTANETETPDFSEMEKTDEENKGKGPRQFPMPDAGEALAAILEAVEIKHDHPKARAALADLRTRLQDAGLIK